MSKLLRLSGALPYPTARRVPEPAVHKFIDFGAKEERMFAKCEWRFAASMATARDQIATLWFGVVFT